MAGVSKIICFGELLLRMGAPKTEKIMQTPRFDVCMGGAEANVAVSLAQFGADVAFVSVVSDNQLGTAALGALKRHGVKTEAVRRTSGRMGLYFLSTGAVLRPSEIVYDRAHSAFAEMGEDDLDWNVLLEGAGRLHISGITPAVGAASAASALRAVKTARANGVCVSFDGNYRAQLWENWQSDGPKILHEILSATSVAFINERDINMIFGMRFSKAEQADAYAMVFKECPHLQYIVNTTREQSSVSEHVLSAQIVSREARWMSPTYTLSGVVDRIGAGDAFAAGVLYGLEAEADPQFAIEFGMAASVIKHSIAGDFNLATIEDVKSAMQGADLDVKR